MEMGIGLDLLIHPYMGFASFSVLFWEESHPDQVRPHGHFDQVSFSSLGLESDDFLYKVFEYKIDVPLISRCVRDSFLRVSERFSIPCKAISFMSCVNSLKR
jgi:hypothetical protein